MLYGKLARRRSASNLFAFALIGCLAMPASAATGDDDYLSYTVKPGDTLYDLSVQFLVSLNSVKELSEVNAINSPRRLPIGQVLRIPRNLIKYDPITLRIAAFSGPVRINQNGNWRDAATGLTLNEGAVVETGRSGFVTLQTPDVSHITLPSNTSVKLSRARHYRLFKVPDVEFSVNRGRAETHAAKQVPQGRFQVITPTLASAVRGTIFNVGHDEAAGTSTTEVTEGLVRTNTSANELMVDAGMGVLAQTSGTLTAAKLLGSPELQSPGKVQTEEKAAFDFAPISGALRYRTQIARDASFLDIIAETESQDAHAEFADLKNGTFFVRSDAIDTNGLHGLSTINSFRRQRAGLVADLAQSALPGAFRINWIPIGEGSFVYRFQLFNADSPSQPLIDEAGLMTPGISMTGLARGKYQWRVSMIQSAPEGKVEVWTPLQSFTVSN